MNFISMNLVTMLYLIASVCFIQALKGLSSPATARGQCVRHDRHGDCVRDHDCADPQAAIGSCCGAAAARAAAWASGWWRWA
jgi:hypothetical protein